MNRGFAIIHAAIAVAVLGIVAAVFYLAIDYVKGVDKKAHERGVRETESAYRARDNEQLRTVVLERERLRAEVARVEKERDEGIARKEAEHAKRTAKQRAEFDSFIADINAGRVVWRDPGQTGPGAACGDRSAAAETPADPGSGAGPIEGGGLSRETQVFLSGEAERANYVLEKLNLCRGVLEEIYASR